MDRPRPTLHQPGSAGTTGTSMELQERRRLALTAGDRPFFLRIRGAGFPAREDGRGVGQESLISRSGMLKGRPSR